MSSHFPLTSPYPLRILSSTLPIVEHSSLVHIHEDQLDSLATQIQTHLAQGTPDLTTGLGLTGDPTVDLPLILTEDAANFCFWAEQDKLKWTVEWPIGTFQDGWYALVACFRRALAEGTPILDAGYLRTLTLAQVKHFFRSSNEAVIPLLEERLANLREVGEVLTSRFHGSFTHWLSTTDYSAPNVVHRLATDFPSFRDVSVHTGQPVYFYKRAQWGAHALSYISGLTITQLDQLAAFADYKLPQILRQFGVFSYAPQLAKLIDTYTLIPSGSPAELEIRAATVWAVELLHQRLGISAADVDNALWHLSQNLASPAPYHRTYTIYY